MSWRIYDKERLAAAGLFFASALVVFVAGLFDGHNSLPLLPVGLGAILLGSAHPTAVAAREADRVERATILASLEARDAASDATEGARTVV